MKKMSRLSGAGMVGVVAFLMAMSAYADERSGSHYRMTGNSFAGGSIYTWASRYNSSGTNEKRTRIREMTRGRVSLFWNEATAYSTEMDISRVISTGDLRDAKLGIDVGGWTVFYGRDSAGVSKSWSWNLEFLRAGVTVWVGPVPVYVEGAVGVGFSVNISLAFGTQSGVAANGSAGGSFYGRVLGGIGYWGFGCGIEGKLKFLGGALISNLSSTYNTTSGKVLIDYYAGEYEINVVVWIWWGRWSVTIFKERLSDWEPLVLLQF